MKDQLRRPRWLVKLLLFALLHGATTDARTSTRRGLGDERIAPGSTGAPYAHPYFWAPFILIGNWK